MSKKYLIPSKSCPKCREKMIYKCINKIGDNIQVEYTCPRKNCVKNRYPLVERVKAKTT